MNSAIDAGAGPAVAPGASGRRRRAFSVAAQTGAGFSLALVFFLIILIPNQIAFSPGGVLLTPTRIILLVLAAPIIFAIASGRHQRFMSFDWCYVGFSMWTFLCVQINYGLSDGLMRGGQNVLETVFVYFLVQCYVNTYKKIITVVNMYFFIVVLLGFFAIIEAFSHQYIFHDLANRMMGLPLLEDSISGVRSGLYRAATVFSHPILYGTFTASVLAYVWATSPTTAGALPKALLVLAATAASLSSAPLLAFMMQAMLLAYERMTRGMPNRLTTVLVGITAFVTFLNLASNRGAFGFLALFTFNPGTAYTRNFQWQYGIWNVKQSPIFGMVTELWVKPWWLNSSIDNYWLAQMLLGGVPSVVLLGLAMLLMARRVYRDPDKDIPPHMARLRRGWAMSLLAMLICGATVHFFDKLQPFFAFQIAIGGAIARVLIAWEKEGGGAKAELAGAASPYTPRRTVL